MGVHPFHLLEFCRWGNGREPMLLRPDGQGSHVQLIAKD